jgi:hypothetical protein
VSHWHPNITINLLDDHTPWQKSAVPAPLNECKKEATILRKYLNSYY